MLWRAFKKRRQEVELTVASTRQRSAGLQVILWTVWTLLVIAVGYFTWGADKVAQRPTNVLGLVIHCVVAGVIGLVVLTVVEMHLEPWRFLDE